MFEYAHFALPFACDRVHVLGLLAEPNRKAPYSEDEL
jgi:hypothetical protein